MKLVDLKKFQELNQGFVSWNRGIVTVDGKNYKIQYVNVGKNKYPYVRVDDERVTTTYRFKNGEDNMIELDGETNDQIRCINHVDNKEELKNREYNFDGIKYYVVGIGTKSIKAFKGKKDSPDYFWYKNLEGRYLLQKLFEVVQQKTLI